MTVSVREFTSPFGRAEVAMDGGKIESISVWLEGILPSGRSKMFSGRTSHARNHQIMRAGAQWHMRFLSLGLQHPLRELQKQCALDGVCISVVPAVRHCEARDYKNRVNGFDLMIFDPLVHNGILMDDDEGNLYLPSGVPKADSPGPAEVFIRFEPSSIPCRKSITTHVLEFGWPDPDFRDRKKKDRRREIRRRLSHAE